MKPWSNELDLASEHVVNIWEGAMLSGLAGCRREFVSLVGLHTWIAVDSKAAAQEFHLLGAWSCWFVGLEDTSIDVSGWSGDRGASELHRVHILEVLRLTQWLHLEVSRLLTLEIVLSSDAASVLGIFTVWWPVERIAYRVTVDLQGLLWLTDAKLLCFEQGWIILLVLCVFVSVLESNSFSRLTQFWLRKIHDSRRLLIQNIANIGWLPVQKLQILLQFLLWCFSLQIVFVFLGQVTEGNVVISKNQVHAVAWIEGTEALGKLLLGLLGKIALFLRKDDFINQIRRTNVPIRYFGLEKLVIRWWNLLFLWLIQPKIGHQFFIDHLEASSFLHKLCTIALGIKITFVVV